MQKKLAVLSLYNHSYNYGGVLQAYAMNRLIERSGYCAEQLLYRKTKTASRQVRSLKEKSISHLAKRSVEKLNTCAADALINKADIEARRKTIDQFKQRFIRDSGVVFTDETIHESVALFDGFVVGSDQIWKPSTVNGVYLLDFVPDGIKKFSYAASIAVRIPENKHALYRNALPRFNGVSVREQCVCDTLQKICSCGVQWVLDPTITLEKADWLPIASHRLVDKPYLFCYFLGEESSLRRFATDYARKCGLKIVTLPFVGPEHSFADLRFGDIRMSNAGPSDFVSLILHADCVLTDSYHAVAFSMLFHRPFWVLHRAAFRGTDLRVSDLLATFDLQNRLISTSDEEFEHIKNNSTLDYDLVDERFQRARMQSLAFLDHCLNGERP